MNPIGFIQSCYPEKFGTPRQPGLVRGGLSLLKIREDLLPEKALDSLGEFSHVWIIFLFHKNNQKKYSPWISPPRLNGERKGLFSTRSPHRPNPIGLSAVRLLKISADTLYFTGGDLIDGTPVLDIKPYIKEYDSIPEAKSGWLSAVEAEPMRVVFDTGFEKSFLEQDRSLLKQMMKNSGLGPTADEAALEFLKNTINDILQEDPRPVAYRGSEENQNPYGADYGFSLYNFNIRFRLTNPKEILVLTVEPGRYAVPFPEI